MIHAEFYKENFFAEWNTFLISAKCPMFFFHRNFMEYHSDRFFDFSTMVFEDGKLIAIVPCSKNGNSLVSHGGLTFGGIVTIDQRHSKMSSIIDTLLAFWKENSIDTFIYKKSPFFFKNQDIQNDVFELWRRGAVIQKRELTTFVDLADFTYSKGRKSSVSKAKRSPLTQSGGLSYLKRFYDLLSASLKNHSTKPVHSLAELNLLFDRFPNNLRLEIVELDGLVAAGSLLFNFDSVVHSQYLCVSDAGKEVCALDFLIDSLLNDFKKSHQFFSFGISTESHGKILNNGLVLQKESFGGRNTCIDTFEIKF